MRLTPNFTKKELECKHCGELPEEYGRRLANYLEDLRKAVGFPLKINSAYRCPQHPREVSKPGGATHAHTRHYAADISAHGEKAYELLAVAALLGWSGIGVRQVGPYKNRFIHLDRRVKPSVWSY